MVSKFEGDLFVDGTLRSNVLSIPEGTVRNAAVADDAKIEAVKLQHQHALAYHQQGSVVAETVALYTVRGVTGQVIDVDIVARTAPAGGDRQFTVDVQKASEAAPVPVSIMQQVVTYDSARSDFEAVQGTITNGALADGDTLLVVVAVSGSSGTQAQDLVVTLTVREDAE